MKKMFKWVAGIVVLLGLIALVFGFIFLGSIIKAGVEQVGPMVTKVPVKVGGASVSLFSGSGRLKGFELGNPEGFKATHAIKVGEVGVSVSPGSVFSGKVVVKSVRVQAPEIIFEQGLKGNNLAAILANVQSVAGTGTTTNQAPASAGPGKKLQVDEFLISGGRITVAATMLGGQGATLALPEIRLANLGQGPDGITPAELTEKALNAVLSGTLKAVAEGGGALAKEGVETLKKTGGETINKLKSGSKLGDLLKKK
jgi:hypothetical protein